MTHEVSESSAFNENLQVMGFTRFENVLWVLSPTRSHFLDTLYPIARVCKSFFRSSSPSTSLFLPILPSLNEGVEMGFKYEVLGYGVHKF